jgi:hypothetical protein
MTLSTNGHQGDKWEKQVAQITNNDIFIKKNILE